MAAIEMDTNNLHTGNRKMSKTTGQVACASRCLFVLFFVPMAVHAGCPYPDRPAVEQTEAGITLNYYATDSVICIQKFILENCPYCKAGWRHRCDAHGDWQPTETCSPGDLTGAKRPPPTSPTKVTRKLQQDKTSRGIDEDLEPVRRSSTPRCSILTDEKASADLLARDQPAWLSLVQQCH